MYKSRKVMAACSLTALLLLPAVAAQASVAVRYFYDSRLPQAQQGVDVIRDTKDTSGVGLIDLTNIGSTYKVNARLCKIIEVQNDIRSCGTEIQNIAENHSYDLPNNGSSPLKKGNTALLQLHNSTWAVVSVSVTGSGRTN